MILKFDVCKSFMILQAKIHKWNQQNDQSQSSLKVFEFCCDEDWLTDWLTGTRKLECVDAPKRTAK